MSFDEPSAFLRATWRVPRAISPVSPRESVRASGTCELHANHRPQLACPCRVLCAFFTTTLGFSTRPSEVRGVRTFRFSNRSYPRGETPQDTVPLGRTRPILKATQRRTGGRDFVIFGIASRPRTTPAAAVAHGGWVGRSRTHRSTSMPPADRAPRRSGRTGSAARRAQAVDPRTRPATPPLQWSRCEHKPNQGDDEGRVS